MILLWGRDMAFKFKLEKVLEYRKQLEEQAMQVLAEARKEEEREAARLDSLQEELVRQQEALHRNITKANERWLTASFIAALQEDIKKSRSRLNRLKEETNRRQTELVVKAQERNLLDKLKSKQAERYAEEEKLKEQRENDETATIRYQQKAVQVL